MKQEDAVRGLPGGYPVGSGGVAGGSLVWFRPGNVHRSIQLFGSPAGVFSTAYHIPCSISPRQACPTSYPRDQFSDRDARLRAWCDG